MDAIVQVVPVKGNAPPSWSVLEKLVVCDTIPLKQESSKIEVLSTAELFATAILHTFENGNPERVSCC